MAMTRVEQLVRQLASPSSGLSSSPHERLQLGKLCEVLKAYMVRSAQANVQQGGQVPMLFTYSSDGTPVMTKTRISVQSGVSGKSAKVRRVGGQSEEFLLQLAFIRFRDDLGRVHTLPILRDPLPLTEGKSSWAVFGCLQDFFPSLRDLGHQGVLIEHFSFDRALFTPLRRMVLQQQAISRSLRASSQDSTLKTLERLLHWTVFTGCACHDVHNSLKWSMWSFFHSDQVLKDMFVVIASLRNSYSMLYDHLGIWLGHIVKAVERPVPAQVLQEVYTALGVEPAEAESLAELGLIFVEGHLQVSASAAEESNLVERITGLVLHVWRFVQFTDSRWVTVGRSCRTLTASLLLGLGNLVEAIQRSPKYSNFHIGGFSKLSDQVRLFGLVASLASHPADSVLESCLPTIG